MLGQHENGRFVVYDKGFQQYVLDKQREEYDRYPWLSYIRVVGRTLIYVWQPPGRQRFPEASAGYSTEMRC